MTKAEIIKQLQSDYGDYIEIQEIEQPDPFVYITPEKYLEFCQYLKDDKRLSFKLLFQLNGSHFDDRFEVVLSLASPEFNHEMVVKVKLPLENPEIKTIIGIWQVADFYELEMMELFGIIVVDHPNPRHLLLIEEWDYGYPMRKGWTGPDFIPMPDKTKSK